MDKHTECENSNLRRSQRSSVLNSQNSKSFDWDRYYINTRCKLVEKRKNRHKKSPIEKNINLKLSSDTDNILNSEKRQTSLHPDSSTLIQQTYVVAQVKEQLNCCVNLTNKEVNTNTKKTKNGSQNCSVVAISKSSNITSKQDSHIKRYTRRKNVNKENCKTQKRRQERKGKRGRPRKISLRDIQNRYIETLVKASSQPVRYHDNANPKASDCAWVQRHDILPRIYPPHFLYQRRLSEGEPTNDSRKNNINMQSLYANPKDFGDNKFDLPMVKDHNTTSSSTLSLTESLCDVFEVNDIRDLLQVQAPIFHLYEHHVQMLAVTLNVDLQYIRNLLENISKLTFETVQKTLMSLQMSYESSHQLTQSTPLRFNLNTRFCNKPVDDDVSEIECSPCTKHIPHFSN